MSFKHRHILDTAQAPCGQLPDIVDGAEAIGDSHAIMAHIKRKYPPSIDIGLSPGQLNPQMLGDTGFVFGPQSVSLDPAIYGFVANIYFYRIDTPLKQYVLSRPNPLRHCLAVHDAVKGRPQKSAV